MSCGLSLSCRLCCCRCCPHTQTQGEFVDKLAELIIKTYGASNSISKPDIYFIQDKKKQPYFDDDSDADE